MYIVTETNSEVALKNVYIKIHLFNTSLYSSDTY